ncbi:MAG: energy transducer TonB, partial [Candidatus Acidiferrales bacterium]
GGWSDFFEKLGALRERLPWLPGLGARKVFRDAAVESAWPGRAVLASLLLHIFFVELPLVGFFPGPGARPHVLALPRIEYDLTWAGTSKVLPPIAPRAKARRKPSPGGEQKKPRPPRGADRLLPQTIVSNPPRPNHPTQTLVRQFTLEKARVDTRVRLPNMVIPDAPTMEADLHRLRVAHSPVDLAEPRSELVLRNASLENLLPRLTLPTASGAGTTEAPEVSAPLAPGRGGDLTASGLIALSAQLSAPTLRMEIPEGSLYARFTTGPFLGLGSPGGIPGGEPGANGGSGGGPGGEAAGLGGLSAPDILVTAAGPVPAGPVIVGLGTEASPPPAPSPPPQPPKVVPATTTASDAPAKRALEQRAQELLESLTPGQQLSTTRRGRRIYTTYINMPNLGSQSGSWVLRFAELGNGGSAPAGAADEYGPLSAPVALKKVDPRYPAEARRSRVEGSVFLYGIIREDGEVESVHVVRSLNSLLDQSAVEAFLRWRFQPGQKNGSAIRLEVVVEIPFRLTRLF